MSSSETSNVVVAAQSLSRLLERLKRLDGKPTLGAVAALLLTLAYVSKKKKSKHVRSLSEVGSTAGQSKAWDEFDVIVIGGGTFGCALAARLSENPCCCWKPEEALPLSRMPSGFGRLFRSNHVFPLYTEPQVFANGKKNFWPRAKMLGGCSSINAQMAQYGAPEDFDDDSWSWKNINKYFRKFEKYTPDPRYPQVDISVRGNSGPVRVGYFNTVSNSAQAFIDACVRVGIPFTPDFNGSNGTMGVSRIMTYVDDKYQRVSSEAAYLTADVLARPNLKVAVHAHVTRILFEDVNGETRAVGVEAGAVHSPHILMLSGVGPAEELKKHGIPVAKDLPGVGANLSLYIPIWNIRSFGLILTTAAHLKSDEEIRNLVKDRVETVYHPTSTCRMAPLEVNGVVNSKLRVHGIKGLRACDASFFPWIISGHTAGACLAAAEKLARRNQG
ncbi:putative gmc oxidoreductase [Moniliophthora roreri MCA 2997]|uniref:Gmc oxidoreductase n=1 Tax=Moniliophthora roreri (strain MCA 2997) TaxID=1381753 RepID=V2XMB9_MONRO|nr:putative gmc oxidoreductase [Moniliophthora roreri MCA 2997]